MSIPTQTQTVMATDVPAKPRPASAKTKAAARKTLMLIDGYGLIFRAYHALPPSLTTSTGEQVNAVFGFASMLLDVVRQQSPDYAIVALEGGRTFRHDAFDGYKANRADMPDDLRRQIARVHQVIETLNLPIVTRDGYEADDVIGSLSVACSARDDLDVLILTGDSDLLQLVTDHVQVVLPGSRRFNELRRFDPEAVLDRYGFAPALVADYKALVGDTSDNIPGVPGIGDKTAKALIQAFGPLEAIIDRIDEVTPTRARNALAEHREQAIMSKDLATIVRDLDVDFDPALGAIGDYDHAAALTLLQELEFRSLIAKLPVPQRKVAAAVTAERPASNRRVITTDGDLAALVAAVRAAGEYALDVETTSTDPQVAELVGIAIATGPSDAAYVPVGHQAGEQLPVATVRAALDPVFRDASLAVYAHHGKYDLAVLERAGFATFAIAFDTMIAAYLLAQSSSRLKDLAFNRLGIQMTEITDLIGTGKGQITMDQVDPKEAGDYACGDVEATFALVDPLRADLDAREQTRLLREVELPLIPVLVDMEAAGIAVDCPFLEVLSEEITTDLGRIEVEIREIAGDAINIGSNRQIATLLFETLGLRSGRKTKTGFSVDSDVLESLRLDHPVVGLILEHRTLSKLKSTYVDALPSQVNPRTGRVHTSYNQTVAATGRLSSTNPNLQNIPIRSELGRRVRHGFHADPNPAVRLYDDPVLLSADYSQIELRLVAHMSGEPSLVEAFRAGEDIHRATAALVAGVDPADVTPSMRSIAKTVNFGVMYGMQSYGLSRDSGLSRADSQRFIDEYWARLPRVRELFDRTIAFGLEHGYVTTEWGRRRYIPQLLSSNGGQRIAGERMAINMPVQGAAADIMKLAMIELHRALADSPMRARMLLQVHDELVLEVHRDDLHDAARLVTGTMASVVQLDVPLVAEVQAGSHWDTMEPVEMGAG
ncbi:MAG: DNA polymerase I [Chloroflexota bacterium]|nr:DNA polymerase I [Chloroflexota bacterium]